MTTTTYTPWGWTRDIEELAEGVWRVSSHGGLKLSRERWYSLPDCVRDAMFTPTFAEEDCEEPIVRTLHRRPRRAEAQPGAVVLAARLRPGRHVHPHLRRRGLRGTHLGDDREREAAVRTAEYFERYAPALPYLRRKGVGDGYDHAA